MQNLTDTTNEAVPGKWPRGLREPLSLFTAPSATLASAIMVTLPGKCAAFMGMGPTELIVILIILLVLFGGSKLPGLAKGLGQSIKEFKKATKDEPEAVKPAEPAAKPADTTGKPPAA